MAGITSPYAGSYDAYSGSAASGQYSYQAPAINGNADDTSSAQTAWSSASIQYGDGQQQPQPQQQQQYLPTYSPQAPIPPPAASASVPTAAATYTNGTRVFIPSPPPNGDKSKTAAPVIGNMKQSKSMQVGVSNLTYIVETPKKGKQPASSKIILNDISIQFRPGRLTVLMGASGAGKTTLMQTIAGDVMAGVVYGTLELNGHPVKSNVLQKTSAFVYQDDVILQTSSVREAITMSAELRLPKTSTPEERTRCVEDTIRILNLTDCADTLIGSQLIRGVSGGERKRCSVGMELVTNPPIIFIDEGTSGLDSKNALSLVQTLKGLARANHTVITTMHQPSSEIFHLFDDLVILAAGEIIYSGPAEEAVEYFGQLGFQCPRYTNPADYFFTSVINSEDGSVSQNDRGKFLIDAWKKRGAGFLESLVARQILSAEDLRKPIPSNEDRISEHSIKAAFDRPGFIRQYALLWKRAARNQLRDRLLFKGRLMQVLVLAIIVGLVYLRIKKNQQSVQDRQGFLFFLATNSVMSSAMRVVSTFHGERHVFIRERGSGMYSLPAYYCAKIATEMPVLILTPWIFITILYWMVGLQADAGKYFLTFVIVCLLSLTGNAIGFFVGSMFNDPNSGLQALPLFLMPMMLFSGFMINDDSIPKYFYWFSYISPMRYGMIALLKNEFTGLELECTSLPCPYQRGEDVIEAMKFDDDPSIGANCAILVGLFTGLMIMAYLSLWKIGSKLSAAKFIPSTIPPEVYQAAMNRALSEGAAKDAQGREMTVVQPIPAGAHPMDAKA